LQKVNSVFFRGEDPMNAVVIAVDHLDLIFNQWCVGLRLVVSIDERYCFVYCAQFHGLTMQA
jgi:hypothetical protein